MADIHKQLADIKVEIEHHKETIKACRDKMNHLRMSINLAKGRIKDLKEKRRKLVFGSVARRR